ncbi:MAG: phosphoribosylformylglycinamidine synthase [Lachnospiraceae bacterium]|nr:phosphoribosylformylglycinamidine synthase [Lachnospiraceae bacterium]
MSVRRLYVEKKKPYAVAASGLRSEIAGYLGIDSVTDVRVLIRYDIENVSDETYERSKRTVFSEAPIDDLYEETFDAEEGKVFTIEYVPGQYDQRADSAEQCVKLLSEDEEPIIKTATTYVIKGDITDAQLEEIKNLCLNPVDSRVAAEEKPDTLVTEFDEPEDVKILEGFTSDDDKAFKDLYESLGLAMTYKDFLFIREHFRDEEKRDPSMAEIRVLDTYWSDHCRHTTFSTELKDITFEEGKYKEVIENTFKRYLSDREELYAGRDDKYICLMDLATMGARKLKSMGLLEDQEETDEINACSIVCPVTVDGETSEWLISFKNETHNHPTEIEPFGGAATCLGGAIRDPLSGRSYVYQAMRITGAADPTVPMSETIKGKLPQKKIVRDAAAGYSSYGNQIGLATGYVKEIYHPDYVAKRMEVGAVMGAAPRANVIRETSDPGDIIILLGGRTGRDGCGGATGSSKVHTEESIETCGAEVQKGNPPTERKIQRLFRRPEVSRLIKKCNDFGAGGVSVAIGELADGLIVNLDKVPKKYEGLDGTEIAISESQERMAVVVAPESVEQFLKYSAEENLEATIVAEVTKEPRLVLQWRGKDVVNIKRAFLDTNGAHQETAVTVEMPDENEDPFGKEKLYDESTRGAFARVLGDLNECSQKGLVEMFDSSIGAGSVMMPYGGKYQMTETQVMVAKLPLDKGESDTVTMMSYGFDPYLSKWSPYHGALYAVVESVSKIVAAGGDYKKIRFSFQEYFRRMTEDPKRWSQPFAALLGAYEAQMKLGLPSIGGKDSMSGTFNDIDVPPTLISFAVDVALKDDVITPEFKNENNRVVKFVINKDQNNIPDFDQLKRSYERIHELIKEGNIISAYTLGRHGMLPAICKMAMGNKVGCHIFDSFEINDLTRASYGEIIAEVPESALAIIDIPHVVVAELTETPAIFYKNMLYNMDEMISDWKKPLEKVFPTVSSSAKAEEVRPRLFYKSNIYICKNKVAKPKVFIPVFPGTNCEYDSRRAFETAGAEVVTKVFKNLTAEDIRESVDEYAAAIKDSQIVMFPGGFSAGDEPEGSAKFFATAFRNAKLKDALEDLLANRDGLVLGICNGFQALIKLGLVPYGKIIEQDENAPTLTYNTIGRHISKVVNTRVVSNKSPWLQEARLGSVYVSPVSHGEGRFVAPVDVIEKLFANGQVATQYVDHKGRPTMAEEFNVNGSFCSIEGITSADGRVLGKMAHCERKGDKVAINIYGEQDMKLFESGVKYFL